jgi:hypothetical protein
MRLATAVFMVLLLASISHAMKIQYLVSTGNITGVREDTDPAFPPLATHGVVTVPGPVSAMVWPVPAITPYTGGPATCPVGSGRWEWTRVSNPAGVTMSGGGLAIHPELNGFFFASMSPLAPACYVVHNWKELRELYRDLFIQAIQALATSEFAAALGVLEGWVYGICFDLAGNPDGSANCTTMRNNWALLNNDYPGSGQGVTFTNDAVTLQTDRDNFKLAKGW